MDVSITHRRLEGFFVSILISSLGNTRNNDAIKARIVLEKNTDVACTPGLGIDIRWSNFFPKTSNRICRDSLQYVVLLVSIEFS